MIYFKWFGRLWSWLAWKTRLWFSPPQKTHFSVLVSVTGVQVVFSPRDQSFPAGHVISAGICVCVFLLCCHCLGLHCLSLCCCQKVCVGGLDVHVMTCHVVLWQNSKVFGPGVIKKPWCSSFTEFKHHAHTSINHALFIRSTNKCWIRWMVANDELTGCMSCHDVLFGLAEVRRQTCNRNVVVWGVVDSHRYLSGWCRIGRL